MTLSAGDPYTIRPAAIADAAAIASVHIRSWQTAYRGIVADAFLDELSGKLAARIERWRENLARLESPQSRTFVAETPAEGIIGWATAGANRGEPLRFRGELYGIYLLAEHRGRGCGRRLVARSVAHLHAEGLTDMLVWVLERNPACSFYRALGGTLLRDAEKTLTLAGQEHREVAYGWERLPALAP